MSAYDRIAWLYDLLAWSYSGGAISQAKHAHLSLLADGERVLYLGAGTAQECVLAARRGVEVTIWDTSSAMLRRAERRFAKASLHARLQRRDALHGRLSPGEFDVVVAPFFLNVFSKPQMASVIARFARALDNGGRFVSVDFRGPTTAPFSWLQRLHYLPPVGLFALLTRNPIHALYDYRRAAQRVAPELCLNSTVVTRAWGLPLYETLTWVKQC